MSVQISKLYFALPENLLGISIYKRLRDILDRGAAALILVILALPMAVIAVLIYFQSGGPVVFSHYRVGRNGNLFGCLKFRTMVVDAEAVLQRLLRDNAEARAEWEAYRKLKNDPRITAVGKFLRATSLDELPQLFNVLRGEMALVGPRPITLEEVNRYGLTRWMYLRVRPGITGLWQVSGRNLTTFEERVAIDDKYVRNRTIWLDINILFRTIKVLILRQGAY